MALFCSAIILGGIGLTERDRSLRNSSPQSTSFGFGAGTFFSPAIGFGGILISGRKPNGGGSNDCDDGCGDFRAIDGECEPLVFKFECFSVGGGGGGAGNTATGIPRAARWQEVGGGGGAAGRSVFVLFC